MFQFTGRRDYKEKVLNDSALYKYYVSTNFPLSENLMLQLFLCKWEVIEYVI